MRGTVEQGTGKTAVARITPAHAGNSFLDYLKFTQLKDHPRSCGEQLSVYQMRVASPGSPPLMRGTVSVPQRFKLFTGITPAHAGNSLLTIP